jgi:hypothetical protein
MKWWNHFSAWKIWGTVESEPCFERLQSSGYWEADVPLKVVVIKA